MRYPLRVGRYLLFEPFAKGGMASVHYGRLVGAAGFSRTFAIKRLHPQFAKNPEFVHMLVDEARLASRIRHPNVVSVYDVVAEQGELFLVLDYVHGLSLEELRRLSADRGAPIPPPVIIAILIGILSGLHAAHEAQSEDGEPLRMVHRDVSPHNVLIGAEGGARVTDFGIAHAAERLQYTKTGMMKGKLRYAAPEQLGGESVDRRTDLFAAGAILWEGLTGVRFREGLSDIDFSSVVKGEILRASALSSDVTAEVDAVVMRALDRDPSARFPTAAAMSLALETMGAVASARQVAEWVMEVAREPLAVRAQSVAAVERYRGGLDSAAPVDDAAPHEDSDMVPTLVKSSPRLVAASDPTLGYSVRSGVQADVIDISVPSESLGTEGMEETRVAVTRSRDPAMRSNWLVAIVALLVTLGAAGGLWWARASADSAPSSEAVPIPAVALAPRIDPIEAEEPAPSASAPLASALAASEPAPYQPRAKLPAPKPKPPKPRPDCDPPYVLDSDGVRVPKRECLP